MRMAYSGRTIFLAVLLLNTFVRVRGVDAVKTRSLRNVISRGDGNEQEEARRGNVIFVDWQPGNDLTERIIAANTALGTASGEIRVTRSGTISKPISLSSNHDLVCAGDGVALALSTAT